MRPLTLTGRMVLLASLTGCGGESTPTDPDAVSLSLTAAPAIGVSPVRLSFVYYFFQRSLQPPSQGLIITNLGGRTLTWTATRSPSWIKIWPRTGTAPSNIKVAVDPAGIPIGYNGSRPGLLQGSIVVSSLGASNTPQTVPVTLYIRYY